MLLPLCLFVSIYDLGSFTKGPPTVEDGKKWNVPGVQLRPEAILNGSAHTVAFHPLSS